jgi:hypothetical protein
MVRIVDRCDARVRTSRRVAERLEASGYDIPASEIEAGMELHLYCVVKVGKGNNGYKTIHEFLPDAAAGGKSLTVSIATVAR